MQKRLSPWDIPPYWETKPFLTVLQLRLTIEKMETEERSPELSRLCPKYEKAARMLAKPWTPLIVKALLPGPKRFTEIRDYVGSISDRLLSQRLKELDTWGIVTKKVLRTTPLIACYELTSKGKELQKVIEALQEWADKWADTC